MDYRGSNAGIEAAKLASKVRAHIDKLYSNPRHATWDDLIKSTSVYYEENMVEAVIEMIHYASSFGLPPEYFPPFWEMLKRIMAAQMQLRVKYAKGDMSSYGYLLGEPNVRGEAVWKLSDKWFTFHMDPGGAGLIEGRRGFGKTLLATQNIALPYIDSYRHVVSGIYIDSIVPDRNPDAIKYYHFHSSMSQQLQTAIQIKIDHLQKQVDKPDYIEGKTILEHPLVIDLIDEASMSRGKYRTMSDKTMQQMYVATIARHIGIWVCEVHPFDDTVVWVRNSLTHEYSFTDRGKLDAHINVLGQKYPEEKKIWGFKSLESRIKSGEPHIRYRPYAPVSFTVDVDVIAMLDHLNKQMSAALDAGKKVDEIEEWRITLKWLKDNKVAKIDELFGLTYNNVVASLAIFCVELEKYNTIMKGTDRYKAIKITRDLVEGVMSDCPFPVKAGTLGGHITKAKRIIQSYDYKKEVREDLIEKVRSDLRSQGAPIDDAGNYVPD